MPEWVRLPLLIVGIMFGGTAIIIGVSELVAFSIRLARRNRLMKDAERKQKERSGEANAPR